MKHISDISHPTGRRARLADVALVDAARGGDEDAFGELYRRYAPRVRRLLRAAVPRIEVDDLVQDVFLSAMRGLRALDEAAAFPAWLAAIARCRAVDHLRRRPPAPLPLPDAIAAGGDHEQTRMVLDAIRSLPAAFNETLLLRLIEGRSGIEIAGRTGLTPASVRVNLHRGMKLLRARLDGARPIQRLP